MITKHYSGRCRHCHEAPLTQQSEFNCRAQCGGVIRGLQRVPSPELDDRHEVPEPTSDLMKNHYEIQCRRMMASNWCLVRQRTTHTHTITRSWGITVTYSRHPGRAAPGIFDDILKVIREAVYLSRRGTLFACVLEGQAVMSAPVMNRSRDTGSIAIQI